MDSRERLEFPNLYDFFIIKKNIFKILPILKRQKKKDTVSLSLLDWFVTNYVKKHQVVLVNNKKTFDIYMEYKSQLRDYGKKYFDPFNRDKKDSSSFFDLNYEGGKITTSFKQLNFLRWVLKNKIIKYTEENFDIIKKDYNKQKKQKKSNDDEIKKITIKRGSYIHKFN